MNSAEAAAGIAILAAFFAELLVKGGRHPASLRAEWAHPVRLTFFPATRISLLLLAAFLRETAPAIAVPVWILGAAGRRG